MNNFSWNSMEMGRTRGERDREEGRNFLSQYWLIEWWCGDEKCQWNNRFFFRVADWMEEPSHYQFLFPPYFCCSFECRIEWKETENPTKTVMTHVLTIMRPSTQSEWVRTCECIAAFERRLSRRDFLAKSHVFQFLLLWVSCVWLKCSFLINSVVCAMPNELLMLLIIDKLRMNFLRWNFSSIFSVKVATKSAISRNSWIFPTLIEKVFIIKRKYYNEKTPQTNLYNTNKNSSPREWESETQSKNYMCIE